MTMPDDAPQTGQRVWRTPPIPGAGVPAFFHAHPMRDGEAGTWLPEESFAALMAVAEAAQEIDEYLGPDLEDALATLRELGLTPPEPKEGGAS